MAVEQDTTLKEPTSVQYKKFEDEEECTDNTNIQTPPPTTNLQQSKQLTSDQPAVLPPAQVQQNGGGFIHPEVISDSQHENNGQRHEVVLQMNGGSPQEETPDWSWYNLILAVCSIFCCTVCGILATVTSILAYVDHRVKDYDASRSKRVAAYALALTALIFGVICMVVVIVLAIHFDHTKPKD